MKSLQKLLDSVTSDRELQFKLLMASFGYFMSEEELLRTIEFYIYRIEKRISIKYINERRLKDIC